MSGSHYRRWYVQADAHDLGRDRPDDLACHCDEPKPMPTTIFGNAMGGMQECQRCGRPIAGSESSNPMGPAPLLLALTSGQRLVVAVVFLIAIVVLAVWPIVRPPRPREIDEAKAWHRLMREIRRH